MVYRLLKSRRSVEQTWPTLVNPAGIIIPQIGSMEADRIDRLPGQPPDVEFEQYAGYVTVDAQAGRALFYYFSQSTINSSTTPLILWLNGGPGCSSLGFGAMQELGPFRVSRDGQTLYHNDNAWNKVANVLFLESPAGVGFSYSNRSSDYTTGDKQTAADSYTFLVNWLQRFPQYKNRDFFITGESYAGHYVPQLASLILSENQKKNQTIIIKLKGIAIGNALVDDHTLDQGMYEYFWTHALNSDDTYSGIINNCDFASGNYSKQCLGYQSQGLSEVGDIDIYNIYAPLCHLKSSSSSSSVNDNDFDPCSGNYVSTYLNQPQVQQALHARNTTWEHCGGVVEWTDSPITILPTISQLNEQGLSIWIYSGDIDGLVTVSSSRYSVNKLNLRVQTAWRPWYDQQEEVGGYVVGYDKGVVLITVRAAGHMVPSYQPQRALLMISSFIQAKLPPAQPQPH